MEGPTASLLILATIINHGLDLLVEIDIDIESKIDDFTNSGGKVARIGTAGLP